MWVEELPNGKFKFKERFLIESTGQEFKPSITLKTNSKQSENKARDLLYKKYQKKLVEVEKETNASGVTFEQACESWLSVYKETVKESSYSGSEYKMKSLIDYFGQDCLLEEMKASDFNQFFLYKLNECENGYSYVNQIKSIIMRVLNHALKYFGIDLIKEAQLLEVPRINMPADHSMKYLEREELNSVLDFFKEKNLMQTYRMILIQVSTGLRAGELVALDYERNINFKERTIVVDRTYTPVGKKFTTPKSGKSRKVFFSSDLVPVLKEQIVYAQTLALMFGLGSSNSLLFPAKDGGPYRLYTYNRNLAKFKKAGKHLTSHIFRHTYITRAVEQGVDRNLIARQVGHADTQMIDKVYAHFSQTMEEKQKEAMTNLKIV